MSWMKIATAFFLFINIGLVNGHNYEDDELDCQPKQTQYYLCMAAIFQNEAPYLKEWIEYHRLIGVEHFYLYNNLSNDNYLEILVPYIVKGIIELTEWPYTDFPACQVRACSDAVQRSKGKTIWLGITDIDEFIVLVKGDNLPDFLKKYEKYAGIGINWQLFGTSEIVSIPEDELQIEHLVYKFPEKFYCNWWNSNHWFKSIVQPALIEAKECTNSHCFKPKKGYKIVDPNKETIKDPWGRNPKVPVDKIRINHYWFRTLDWFYHVKMTRPWVSTNSAFTPENIAWLLKVGNTELDLTISRFVPELKNHMLEN